MYQVLIVDDEPIVKIALRSMIDWSALDFHICATASNGEEALQMAERLRPQLIICDLKMPKLDGIGLIKAVQAQKIPCEFLVISNYEDFDYVRSALLLGATDYILKISLNPEELTSQLEKVRRKLDKQKQEQAENLSAEEHALRQQERHDTWREFFTHEDFPPAALRRITEHDIGDEEKLALCLISFDCRESGFEALPSRDLLLNTIKNALEQVERRHILFFNARTTLLILPESELEKHQKTMEALAARIRQLFEYYLSLKPTILYKDQIPGLSAARQAFAAFQEQLKEISPPIPYRSPEVRAAIGFIRENYKKKISLNMVADHVGLSTGYLCRIFKEETGVSINTSINDLRMEKAAELLKDKDSYIKEVAMSVGFEDQLYFSRMFKRYYGMTPSEYRAENT